MADLISTFRRLETEAKRRAAKEDGTAIGLISIEETRACAEQAAEQAGMSWEDARAALIDSFATLAG